MTQDQIKEVLRLHKLWLGGESGGVRANLSYASLSYADLSYAPLSYANLSYTNLYGANLSYANLSGASLYGANISGANLGGANLTGANISYADLSYANLSDVSLYGANISGASLKGANLSKANLSYASLKGANLTGASLYGANISGANLGGAELPPFQICPQEGSFIGYKKTTKGVIKLLIPDDAKRTNSLVGRKCRASKVVVIGGKGVGGTGTHHQSIIYKEGNTIVCDDYDGDIRVECTKGIHFFMTLAEAEEWE